MPDPMTTPPRMTAVFEYDLKQHPGNPFHTDTPFGRPLVLQPGDFSEEEAVAEDRGTDNPKPRADLCADPALLAEAVEVLEGVTPGPWTHDGDPSNLIVWDGSGNRVCFMAHSNGLDDARDVATARFIAWCREGVPALLARIAAMEAQIKGLIKGTVEASKMALDYIAKLEAAEAKLAEWKASQHYSYIGADGKPVLARDLEARAEAAEAKVAEYEAADGMNGAIVHAIRLLLNSHNVPGAAFIDDHVGNAIAQRDAAETALAAMTKERDDLRDCIAWVDEVYPERIEAGGAGIQITWDEFNAMQAAIGVTVDKRIGGPEGKAVHNHRLRNALAAERAKVAKLVKALERIANEDEGDADLNEWGSAAVARDTLERLARAAITEASQ